MRVQWAAVLACVLAVAAVLHAPVAANPVPIDDTVHVLRSAERIDLPSDGGAPATTPPAARSVQLPDRSVRPAGAPQNGPLRRQYCWDVERVVPASGQRAGPSPGLALYFSGLRSHGRLALNGHVLHDTSDAPAAWASPPPRGADQLLLVRVPATHWQTGINHITLDVVGRRSVSVSPLSVGPATALAAQWRWRVFTTVTGPLLVAAVDAALGGAVLFLWWRRREALYAYFGMGMLGWALHTAWSVAPLQLLPQPHLLVWWNALYGLFVALLVLFCVRFADWRWPLFERTVLASVAVAPLLLYAALWADPDSAVPDNWRLALIALVAVAVLALGHVARRARQRDAVLIAGVGAAALCAALHDWWVSWRGLDNNPVYLVPYVGLLFSAFVLRMLIDRFLQATRGLEQMNAELARRVDLQHAELRQALEQMRQARDAAEAADQAKTRFLAAASHDLRQPAHALALYMAALRAGPLQSEQADLAQRMGASMAALDSMFSALLDVSRIDAGGVAPQWERLALAPLLLGLADEWAPEAEARGLRLALHLADPATATVSDGLLLGRVLRNLLGNAIKYTHSGGVLLACRVRTAADGSRGLRIELWDTGIGIAPAEQARVFEEFYQVGNTGRDRANGLGLGLAIVRRLAPILQLRVQLHSRPGRGSVFFVEGLVPAGPVLQQPSQPGAETRHLAGSVVAVVEDDADVRDAMCRLLALWGCRVAHGSSADEVQKSLAGVAPQDTVAAVIADVRLGAGRCGTDEAEALFAAWGLRRPLLLVSGETAPERLRDLRQSGHTCMPKPVPPAQLRAWLEHAVQAGHSRSSLPA